MEFWGQKSFCLITGASRGIGKCIAIEFSKKFASGSTVLLLARSSSELEITKNEILNNSSTIHVVTSTMDLSSPHATTFHNLITNALSETSSSTADYNHAILVHNAGSLGNVSLRILEQDNLSELQNYFTLNVFSMILLTSAFFKIFTADDNDKTSKLQRSVIQLSSLAAITPFKTLGQYCAGKAVRDMIMRSIATEEDNEENSISVINYAPGPIDTEMYTKAMAEIGDTEVRTRFNATKEKGELLTCIQTVTKLIKILEEKKYTKGEHVDYYDNVTE